MTEHCLAKLREGLSSHNMLDIVCGLDRDLLHDTINQYASLSLLQEFQDTPYLDLLRPYDRRIIEGSDKLLDIARSFNEVDGPYCFQEYVVVCIIYRIYCENMQVMLSHRNLAQAAYNKLDYFNRFPRLTTWIDQVRILFNQAGVEFAPQQLNTVNAVDPTSDGEFDTDTSNDTNQRRVLIYEPTISRLPECIVSAIISSKKTCPCCFDELTIPTTIIMTSCCWDCYCINCVRKLHAPSCPSCRTPFDFQVARILK